MKKNNMSSASKQESDNQDKSGGTNNCMFDNPFMDKVPNGSGDYIEMPRQTTIIPEPVIESETKLDKDPYEITEDDFYKSLTSSALQEPGWRTPTEFPCCPKEVKPDGLKEYEDNLKPGLAFTTNEYDTYYVIEKAIRPKGDVLFVLSTNKKEDGYYGTYSVVAIDIKFNKYVHISMKRFGHITDATKYYKFLIGKYNLTENEAIMYLDT